MHPSVMNFARKILTVDRVKDKRILEVGSFNVNGSVQEFVKPLLPTEYIGVDITPQEGFVDKVMDACDILEQLGAESWDIIISTEMLDQAADWSNAVRNMKECLKPGGLLLLTARGPGFPLYNHPADHWRFTTDDAASMFSDFTTLYLSDDTVSHPGFLFAGIKGKVQLPPPNPAPMPYHSREAFDERMRVRRLPDASTPYPFKAFYHIGCMGHWKEVVEEQCAVLSKVGIRPTTFVLGTAADVEWLSQFDLDLVGSSVNLQEFETPTLALLDRWCEENPEGAVLYMHTKGVTQPDNKGKQAWRQLMMHYVVNFAWENLKKLKVADMLGVNWKYSNVTPHFSGNFWMARADWINSLPNVEAYKAAGGPCIAGEPWVRMHAEMWLGCRPWHHLEIFCCQDTSFCSDDEVVLRLLEAATKKDDNAGGATSELTR